MSSLLNPLLSYLLLYKYLFLFVLDYAAALILPLPTNPALLAVGAFAGQGYYFNLWISLGVVVIANTLGDLTGYGITRKYGEAAIRLLRLNRLRFFRNLEAELRTDAKITVFTTRFAGALSPVANFLAGMVGVPFMTFLPYDFLGNFIEPGAALTLGWIAGSYWNEFSGLLDTLAAIVAVAVIMFILYRIHRRMAKKYSS
ncbi:MAG: VTT domain-containing protein [Patescibacteria group bacterium]|nr:VTT domain-containing protein [Patescibacteria group bacterium]